VAHEAIPEINDLLKPKFTLVDGTITMQGNGPRNGDIILTHVLFACKDLVVVDSAISDFMGFKNKPRKLFAEKIGLGTINYEVMGDDFKPLNYKKPDMSKHLVFKIEFFFRNLPITNWLFFKTPLFKFFSWCATQYNRV